jgi:hypothetical protein
LRRELSGTDEGGCTAAPETKPLPCTVRVKAGLPAATAAGESEVRVGAPAARTVKVAAALFAPVPLETKTETPPGVAIREAATWAVS